MTNKVIFCCLLLTICFACEKDTTSTNSKNIVGNWQLISADPNDEYLTCDYEGAITFKADHTLLDLDLCEDVKTTGTWTIQDNILSVANDEFPVAVDMIIISLSSSKLTIKFMGVVEDYIKISDVDFAEIEAMIGVNSDCQTCRTVSYENGSPISYGTAAEYCGAELLAIKTAAPVTVGSITCNSQYLI